MGLDIVKNHFTLHSYVSSSVAEELKHCLLFSRIYILSANQGFFHCKYPVAKRPAFFARVCLCSCVCINAGKLLVAL